LVRGAVGKRKSVWKLVIAVLRKRGLSFVVEPFASYMTTLKNLDPASCLEEAPCKFYSIAMEYFNGDEEAVRFFLDYIFAAIAPDKFSLRMEIIRSMKECDEKKAKDLIKALLNSATA